MPFTSLCIFPDISLSIIAPSKDHPIILPTAPAYDETLSYDVINDVVYGEGHYLKHPQTINLMESEFLYPDLANRQTTQEWEESGKQTIYDVAHLKLKQMMKDYYPEYIDNKTDDKIRSKFPIRLKKERMQSNPNWK